MLIDTWNEAVVDYSSTDLSNHKWLAYMYKGIKIVNIDGDIKIYNSKYRNIEYREINEDQYELFNNFKYKEAIHQVLKDTYRDLINIVTQKIQHEVNTRNNKKHYDSLKNRRQKLINKYTNISNL